MSLHRALILSYLAASVRVFHNVLQVFTMFNMCFMLFTMFSESRNDRHSRPPIALGICDNTAGILDNAEKVIPC